MSSISPHIYLLTSKKRFYGQSRKPWVPIDTQVLVDKLRDCGFQVTELEYHQAVKLSDTIRNSVILYSFSQIENTRNYLKDLIRILMLNDNLLLPSYDLLLCHENKGFQELYKRSLGISSLEGTYLCSRDDLDAYELKFPLVLKSVDGSNANGVHLVRNRNELMKRISGMEERLSLADRLDLFRRRYFRTKRSMPGWENYHPVTDEKQYRYHISPKTRFVLQEFVPGLSCDYRVIILGDKYYVSKRLTRKGDWRASGTKLFTYETEPNPAILDYARTFFDKVGLPILAMDLGQTDKGICLFEFQASHFGITPIQCGPGYFCNRSGNWEFISSKGKFEEDIAQAVSSYLKARSIDPDPR